MALNYRGQQISGHHSLGETFGITESALHNLMAFKARGRKDDPARHPGLHGPYEELHILQKGRLPDGYYSKDDPEPWGLLVEESRSNILWQVLSGMLDRNADFGTAYMGLALDQGLGAEPYEHELKALHRHFSRYMEQSSLNHDHQHSAMGSVYRSVSCPACSVLTTLACQDEGMRALFQEMLSLPQPERRALLNERGLLPLMRVTMADLPEPANPPRLEY